jgi:hypothetical protein
MRAQHSLRPYENTFIRDRTQRNDLYTTVIKFGVSGSF